MGLFILVQKTKLKLLILTQLLHMSVKVIPYCFPYSYFCNKNRSSKFELLELWVELCRMEVKQFSAVCILLVAYKPKNYFFNLRCASLFISMPWAK